MDSALWTFILALCVAALAEGHRDPPGHRWSDTDQLYDTTDHQQCRQRHHGCTVQENECRCDTVQGCRNPWPYTSVDECTQDLHGSLDVCKHHHHCGRGFCVQTKQSGVRTARCECAGSGYYGKSCQNKCPEMLGRLDADFPPACLLS